MNRKLRCLNALVSQRDVCCFQDFCAFPDGAFLVYELSVQHRYGVQVGLVRGVVHGDTLVCVFLVPRCHRVLPAVA